MKKKKEVNFQKPKKRNKTKLQIYISRGNAGGAVINKYIYIKKKYQDTFSPLTFFFSILKKKRQKERKKELGCVK